LTGEGMIVRFGTMVIARATGYDGYARRQTLTALEET
jgi:hypothetical protein